MTLPLLAALMAAIGCATTAPTASSSSVRIVSTTPASGSTVTAGTRVQVVVEYSAPGYHPGWDRVIVAAARPGKDSFNLRKVPIKQPDGRIAIELMAVEMADAPFDGPVELQAELVHVDSSRVRTVVKANEKPAFTAHLTDYNGQRLHHLGPSEGRALVAINPMEDPYRIYLPPPFNRPGMILWGLYKVCVDRDGHVFNVSVLKSADGLADGDWMTKLASWPHRPYLVDGTPNPYCYPIRMAVRSDQ